MRCARCNKPLSDPQSIEQGFGPICYAIVKNRSEADESEGFETELLDLDLYPLDESIVLQRISGEVDEINGFNLTPDRLLTNVPHIVCRHSPTGYEWGYGGSGPAELALNICEYYLRILRNEGYELGKAHSFDKAGQFGVAHDATLAVYQDFKREFIATAPKQGGTLPANEVMSWLKNHIQKQTQLL